MSSFIHPCPGTRLTSPFGYRIHPITKKRTFHQGLDFAKTGEVPILASANGVVKQYIGDSTTYGKVIFIEHNINGVRFDTTYAHLKSKLVKNGDKVKQGQIIGYMGNTGGSTGQHLHFEIHKGPWKSGQPNAVDPMLYIDSKKEDKESEEDRLMKEEIKQLKAEVENLKKINKEKSDLVAKQKVEWAEKAIQKAVKSKVMTGDTKGQWNPNKPLTRAEMAVILERLNLI